MAQPCSLMHCSPLHFSELEKFAEDIV